jgi:hypothetical protein
MSKENYFYLSFLYIFIFELAKCNFHKNWSELCMKFNGMVNYAGICIFGHHCAFDHVVTAQLNLNWSWSCHSPTQPQLELELDLIMGRNCHSPTQPQLELELSQPNSTSTGVGVVTAQLNLN